MAASTLPLGYRFGHVYIKDQFIFMKTKLSYAFVNIKPVVPGHVLVAPKRYIERFEEMTDNEVNDLFCTAKKVSSAVKTHFDATSMTLAIQDGPEAGQTVKHVHLHILPRKKEDFVHNDDIYRKLELHDKELMTNLIGEVENIIPKLRTEIEMGEEASLLQSYFK